MQIPMSSSPPIGFRKAIPTLVKLRVVLRQEGQCAACGKSLLRLEDTQFDHVPAIQLRVWCADEKDTIPSSNEPDCIFAKHVDCHREKTSGRRGESKLSKVGGDVSEIARTKRLTKKHEEFRQMILKKGDSEQDQIVSKRVKKKWPTRSFARKSEDGKKASRKPSG